MARNDPLSPREATLGMLGLGVFMAVGAVIGFPQYVVAHRSQVWPTTKGTVTRVEARDGWFKGHKWGYVPQVDYTYAVDGTTFTGNRIGFRMNKSLARDSAERVLRPYAVGREVTVFYDPSDPAASYLEPGLRPPDRVLAWACPVFFFGGILAAVVAARRLRRMPQ